MWLRSGVTVVVQRPAAAAVSQPLASGGFNFHTPQVQLLEGRKMEGRKEGRKGGRKEAREGKGREGKEEGRKERKKEGREGGENFKKEKRKKPCMIFKINPGLSISVVANLRNSTEIGR